MQFFFSLVLAALLLPASTLAQDDPGSWNAHFQTPCIGQVQPAFHSDTDGPHSLRADAGASHPPLRVESARRRMHPGCALRVDRTRLDGPSERAGFIQRLS